MKTRSPTHDELARFQKKHPFLAALHSQGKLGFSVSDDEAPAPSTKAPKPPTAPKPPIIKPPVTPKPPIPKPLAPKRSANCDVESHGECSPDEPCLSPAASAPPHPVARTLAPETIAQLVRSNMPAARRRVAELQRTDPIRARGELAALSPSELRGVFDAGEALSASIFSNPSKQGA